MSGVHNLCKLDYPIYCCSPFESKSVMVGGGGGALGPKTGVRNAVELLELDQRRNEVIANPTMSLGLGKACAWNMDTHRSRQLVAFGRDGECRVYHIKRTPLKAGGNQNKNGLTQRKNIPKDSKEARHAEGLIGGVDNFYAQEQAILQTDTKNFQKGVKFSPNGQRIACAGSDGTISVWDLASQQAPVWKWKNIANDEIQCIDWSPDSKWLVSAFRDGTAFLHDAQNGKLCTELHTLFLISQGTDAYRFRSVKFIPGSNPNEFGIVSAHEPRRMTKPPTPCLVAGWRVKPQDELYRLAEPVVVRELAQKVSSMTVSDDGKLIGLGCSDGSVDVFSSCGMELILRKENVHDATVTACCFLPSEKERTPAMFTVSYDNTVRLVPVVRDATYPISLIIYIVFFIICCILYCL